MTQATLDEWQAEALARQGIKAVTSHNPTWSDSAGAILASEVRGKSTIKQDELRCAIEARLGPPDHPNAWGGVFRRACNVGIIRNSGFMAKSRIPSSHGRMVPIYSTERGAA